MRDRDSWLLLGDEELVRQCRVDTCRGTGPGGQKRNKTSSAVRLTHLPSGVSAANDESRSQHLNRTYALRNLRLHIALKVRLEPEGEPPGAAPGINSDAFPLWAARILDILNAAEYRISVAAPLIGVSSGRLGKDLAKVPALLQAVNAERISRGMKPVRKS